DGDAAGVEVHRHVIEDAAAGELDRHAVEGDIARHDALVSSAGAAAAARRFARCPKTGGYAFQSAIVRMVATVNLMRSPGMNARLVRAVAPRGSPVMAACTGMPSA